MNNKSNYKMSKYFLFIFFSIFWKISLGQSLNNDSSKTINAGGLNIEYMIIDDNGIELKYYHHAKMPVFPGGLDSLGSYLKNNIKYPQKAKQENIQGQVRIAFTIDTAGSVKNIEVVKSASSDIDTMCINVLSKMPLWESGVVDNSQKVSVRFLLPLNFKLKNKK